MLFIRWNSNALVAYIDDLRVYVLVGDVDGGGERVMLDYVCVLMK